MMLCYVPLFSVIRFDTIYQVRFMSSWVFCVVSHLVTKVGLLMQVSRLASTGSTHSCITNTWGGSPFFHTHLCPKMEVFIEFKN
jgi:hypothetical protein